MLYHFSSLLFFPHHLPIAIHQIFNHFVFIQSLSKARAVLWVPPFGGSMEGNERSSRRGFAFYLSISGITKSSEPIIAIKSPIFPPLAI